MSSDNIKLQTAEISKLDLIEKWLLAAHVRRWWFKEWADSILSGFNQPGVISEKSNIVYIVTYRGKEVGLVHSYPSPTEKTSGPTNLESGLRYLIGEKEYLNQNLGSLAVKKAITVVFKNKVTERIVSEPQADNWPAIISLQRAGFRNRGRIKRPGFNLVQLTFSRHLLSKN
ncbi:acetyltransferase [Alphaproteobacteria bacterium]|nr:acetyltransferase [Alphaproteobacteria bacterium]